MAEGLLGADISRLIYVLLGYHNVNRLVKSLVKIPAIAPPQSWCLGNLGAPPKLRSSSLIFGMQLASGAGVN